jgi:hypothetical protein
VHSTWQVIMQGLLSSKHETQLSSGIQYRIACLKRSSAAGSAFLADSYSVLHVRLLYKLRVEAGYFFLLVERWRPPGTRGHHTVSAASLHVFSNLLHWDCEWPHHSTRHDCHGVSRSVLVPGLWIGLLCMSHMSARV